LNRYVSVPFSVPESKALNRAHFTKACHSEIEHALPQ